MDKTLIKNIANEQPVSLIQTLFDALDSCNPSPHKSDNKTAKIATAESCTGGMVSMLVTRARGASSYFDRGFVTYSNEAKMDQLGVSATTLDTFGAVSAETAMEMASGALQNSVADFAISITGVAGPDGGSTEKPVGLVFIGIADKISNECEAFKHVFSGSREIIRTKSALESLHYLLKRIENVNEEHKISA